MFKFTRCCPLFGNIIFKILQIFGMNLHLKKFHPVKLHMNLTKNPNFPKCTIKKDLHENKQLEKETFCFYSVSLAIKSFEKSKYTFNIFSGSNAQKLKKLSVRTFKRCTKHVVN